MKCPHIKNMTFSQTSINALDEIKRKKQLSNLLSTFLVTGNLSTIFLGANTLSSTYSVYSTDFDTLTRAMKTVPILIRSQVENIAADTYMGLTNYKEKQFWKAVYLGCKVK
jgi:hypothetical protein